jgi:dUTP pyrophosphatase
MKGEFMMNHVVIELFKMHPDVPDPVYGTGYAACFDLHCFPTGPVIGYSDQNVKIEYKLLDDAIVILPGDRVLVPTGLVMRIKDAHAQFSIRLHARSGLALKNGLVLANSEGVVDLDYQEEIFAMIHNISKVPQMIKRGDRICQGEVVSNYTSYFLPVTEKPKKMGDRTGGFGSTGV